MSRRDLHHQAVRNALLKDGWTVTHDPLTLPFGLRKVFVDMGAQRLIAAERAEERIAVEVKSFLGPSEVADLEGALGQFVLYRTLLARHEPDRRLFLAVPTASYDSLLGDDIGRAVREDNQMWVLVFDPVEEVVRQWLK